MHSDLKQVSLLPDFVHDKWSGNCATSSGGYLFARYNVPLFLSPPRLLDDHIPPHVARGVQYKLLQMCDI
jgi:hypothetical protein